MKKANGQREEYAIHVRIQLLMMWAALLLLYIYADIFSFYRTGYIHEVMMGFMGSVTVDQTTLAVAGVLMMVPVLVILAGLFLKARQARFVHIVAAVAYTAIGVGNLIGETWVYYWVYGVMEICLTIAIAVVAWRWSERKKPSSGKIE